MTAEAGFRPIDTYVNSFVFRDIQPRLAIIAHHHNEEYFLAIAGSHPAHSPAVYAVSQRRRLAQSQELGLHLLNSRLALVT